MKNKPPKLSDAEMLEWMNRKLNELRSKSYEELRLLPEEHDENPPDERFGAQHIYCEPVADNRLKIVVQAKSRPILGGCKIAVDGFWIGPDGELVKLPDEELWGY